MLDVPAELARSVNEEAGGAADLESGRFADREPVVAEIAARNDARDERLKATIIRSKEA